jgi:hypothetical protein
MLVLLMGTVSVTAEQETGGGEETAGYCQNLTINCSNQCLGSWYGCRSLGTASPELCQDQYDWCMDSCMGSAGDFWCGYRQY